MSASASYSNASQETTNTDKRLTAQGDILAFQDSNLDTGGGSVSIVAGGSEVARAALATVGNLASEVTAGSNAIAAQVADSQRQFVETASGQKTVLYVIGAGLLGVLILPKMLKP